MRIYHNFSEGFKSADMLEIAQVLERIGNLWYIAEITSSETILFKIKLNYDIFQFLFPILK